MSQSERESFYPASRAEWRAWLEQHYATSSGVWLILEKKGDSEPPVSYGEAVEEALCFGWIDSRVDGLDDTRRRQLFTPRKRGSGWSRLNKQRVERLLAEGRMTPAGLAKIEAAKQDGSWAMFDAIDALVVAPDLEQALSANPAAQAGFHAFSNSVKKQLLWWVESAKRPETRQRRITQLVEAAAENRNPLNRATNRNAGDQGT